jgi:hypothetical protein
MKHRLACHLAAIVVALLGGSTSLFAQSGVRQSVPGTLPHGGMQGREWALSHIPDEVNKHFKKEQISLFAQVREDFTRLQIINNQIMQEVIMAGHIDRKLIAARTSEINKRAGRLSETLALPRLDDKAKNQRLDDEGNYDNLRAGLLALDHCIMSFITNPLFKQPNVIDASLALKARRDLDLIIRLSKRLKTSFRTQ